MTLQMKWQVKYRNLDSTNVQQVLDDIYNTALYISLRGQLNSEEFKLLQKSQHKLHEKNLDIYQN